MYVSLGNRDGWVLNLLKFETLLCWPNIFLILWIGRIFCGLSGFLLINCMIEEFWRKIFGILNLLLLLVQDGVGGKFYF